MAIKVITAAQQTELEARCWALNKVAKAQRIQQEASEPAGRFLELLRAALLSGQAHIAGLDGGAPAGDCDWGWRLVGSGDHERLVSQGKCVGWLDGNNLYLEPSASFAVAQDLGRSAGEPLAIGQITVNKRLHEKGLLASIEAKRGTLTVRHRVLGKSIPVLHLRVDALIGKPQPNGAAPVEEAAETEVFTC